MWNRKDIKEKGKVNFKKNYWKSVVAGIVYALFFFAASTATSRKTGESIGEVPPEEQATFVAIILAVAAAVFAIFTVAKIIDIFVINPLEVGCDRFFLVNQDQNADLGELGYAYKNNYLNIVLGLLLRDVILVIGTILFIIPGLILSYSYRMVPYILAEDPQIGVVDALKKSRAMMNGHKWSSFVYDLSFLGWYLLSACTCGVLAIFYVNPYKFNADAALYQAIK